mmetsp:Transcript_2372/g.3217  ORF Transcript_2372/g.3217 Transcript_2372/m.3217 type:complete len:92 (+) Transcript_2372:49-324(+)
MISFSLVSEYAHYYYSYSIKTLPPSSSSRSTFMLKLIYIELNPIMELLNHFSLPPVLQAQSTTFQSSYFPDLMIDIIFSNGVITTCSIISF